MQDSILRWYPETNKFRIVSESAGWGCAEGLRRLQVFLDEAGAEVDVDLNEGRVPEGFEAVDFAGLDDEDVAGAALESFALDCPKAAAFTDELDFVIRMAVRAGTGAGFAVEEEHGDAGVALLSTDEFVGTADEGQILLADVMHAWDPPVRINQCAIVRRIPTGSL